MMAPSAVVARRPRVGATLFGVFGFGLLGLSLLQTGLFARGLAQIDVSGLISTDGTQGQCKQILTVLGKAGVVIGEPTSAGLVVRGADWDRLPAPAREAVMECARQSVSPDADAPIRTIRR